MTKFDCVGDDLAFGVHFHKPKTTIGVDSGANLESFLGTKVPGSPRGVFDVNEYATTNWTQWGVLLKSKGPLKYFQGEIFGLSDDCQWRLSVSSA
jgi:hypothetical protein